MVHWFMKRKNQEKNLTDKRMCVISNRFIMKSLQYRHCLFEIIIFQYTVIKYASKIFIWHMHIVNVTCQLFDVIT